MRTIKIRFIVLVTSVSLLLTACLPPDVDFFSKNSKEGNPESEEAFDTNITEQDSEIDSSGGSTDEEVELITVKKKDLDDVQREIDSKDRYNKALEEEVKYYKNYVQSLVMQMNTEKVEELIQKEWNYNLSVNGVSFPSNGILELSATEAEITLIEKRVPYSVLTDEQSISGRAKGFSKSSIKIEGYDPTTAKDFEGTGLEVIYNLSELDKGEEYKLTIGKSLAERLGVNTTTLVIKII